MSLNFASSHPLASYLAGRRPEPNGLREEEAAVRAENEALAASIGDRFLRPDVDRHMEREARRAATEAPPGAVEETLAARGLLPEGLQTPRRFAVGRLEGPMRTSMVEQAYRHADAALPSVVARWSAVSAGLELLGEVEARAAVWRWYAQPQGVIVLPRDEAARSLDNNMTFITKALLDMMGDPNSFTSSWAFPRRWNPTPEGPAPYAFRDVRCNLQARCYIDNHVRWRRGAASKERLGFEGERWLADRRLPHRRSPRTWGADTFADFPDPFEPMVDILRLGLGALTYGSELTLLVPEDP